MHRVQACQRLEGDLEIQSSKAEELQFSVDYMTTEKGCLRFPSSLLKLTTRQSSL